ncbi:MAG: aminodeoxychorismate/anthranilate synthase component II, partial [Planctomycetota bacterium]
GADRIVISPGPKTPAEAGLSTAVVARFGGEVPLLGVCLGHQCLSAAFGGKVEPAVRLMHGKTSAVEHDGSGLFAGLESPLTATRYHSLAVPPDAVPAGFVVNAWVDDPATGTQEVMGIRHTEKPIHGLQFHPESFLTDRGHEMLRNFLAAA